MVSIHDEHRETLAITSACHYEEEKRVDGNNSPVCILTGLRAPRYSPNNTKSHRRQWFHFWTTCELPELENGPNKMLLTVVRRDERISNQNRELMLYFLKKPSAHGETTDQKDELPGVVSEGYAGRMASKNSRKTRAGCKRRLVGLRWG